LKIRVGGLIDYGFLHKTFEYLKITNRKEIRRVLKVLIDYTKADSILIPKSVHREFMEINKIKRDKFLSFLEVEINKLGLYFSICPIFDRNKIENIKNRHEIDLGESDAINQMTFLNEKKPRLCFFMTNDKKALNLNIENTEFLPWEEVKKILFRY